MSERFLVGGASGAIGAWVVRQLLEADLDVVALTVGDDDRRLRLLTPVDRLGAVHRIDGADRDPGRLRHAMRGVSHVIHADAVSEQACLDGPVVAAAHSLGSFAALLQAGADAGVERFVYESSTAVDVGPSGYASGQAEIVGTALRASFHRTAEILAARLVERVATSGLRRHVVYGPGQDAGIGGSLTRGIAAAAADRPYGIPFAGPADLQYVADVAASLVEAARHDEPGASLTELHGASVDVDGFVDVVAAMTGSTQVAMAPRAAPLPEPRPDASCRREQLPTPLEAGIRDTVEVLRWAPKDLH